MVNAIGAYGEAIGCYSKNIVPFMAGGLAVLFTAIIAVVAIVFFALIPAVLPAVGFTTANIVISYLVAALSILPAAAIIAGMLVVTKGYYGVSEDMLSGNEVSAGSVFLHAKLRWSALFGVAMLQAGCVILLVLLLIAVPVLFAVKLGSPGAALFVAAACSVVFAPLIALAAMMFEPAYPVATVEYVGPFTAVRKGLGIIRRNPGQMLVFFIITAILAAAGIIPFVQHLFVMPVSCTALTLLYKQDKAASLPKKKNSAD